MGKKRDPGSSNCGCLFESGIVSRDGVEDGDELSDGGDHGEFEGFSFGSEALIEAMKDRVLDLYGAERTHIGDVAQMFAAA